MCGESSDIAWSHYLAASFDKHCQRSCFHPEITAYDIVDLEYGDHRDTREEHVDAEDVDQLDDLSRRIEGCDRAKDEVVDTHRFHDLPREGEQRLLAVVEHRIAEAIVGNCGDLFLGDSHRLDRKSTRLNSSH